MKLGAARREKLVKSNNMDITTASESESNADNEVKKFSCNSESVSNCDIGFYIDIRKVKTLNKSPI